MSGGVYNYLLKVIVPLQYPFSPKYFMFESGFIKDICLCASTFK